MEDTNLVRKSFYEGCNDVTLDDIGVFLKGLMEKPITYNTLVYAMGAGLLACSKAMDKHSSGGLTGFQAGFVMWEFIHEFMYPYNKCGMRLIDFDNLLYPQYADKFEKYLTKTQWELLQKEAKKNIDKESQDYIEYTQAVKNYPSILSEFEVVAKAFSLSHPELPSYEDNPAYYEEPSTGDGEVWDTYYKKKKIGVPFKPKEPCYLGCSKSVLSHWQSIVDGVFPFGFKIQKD